MAWTIPTPTVVGQLMTAAFWNAQVTANILEQSRPPSARTGSPIYASTAGSTVFPQLTAPVFNTGLTFSAGVTGTVAANAGAFTVVTAGRYIVTATGNFINTPAGIVQVVVNVAVNGVTQEGEVAPTTAGLPGTTISISPIIECAVGDRIQPSTLVFGASPNVQVAFSCAMLYRT